MPEVQDLNKLGAPDSDAATPSGRIIEKSYDPAPYRENIRGSIALALVWTLVVLIAIVVLTGLVTEAACHAKDACSTETIELKTTRVVIEMVLTPLIGLVGAVTGFYFGEKSAAGGGKRA
jgi:hypothetical protein